MRTLYHTQELQLATVTDIGKLDNEACEYAKIIALIHFINSS